MKKAFLNFIRSFYSIEPYVLALQGRASGGFNFLIAMLIFCIVSVFAVVAFALVMRYASLDPIVKNFPDIEIIKGYAKIDRPMPVVLTGTPGRINSMFLKEKNPKDAVFNVYMDTRYTAKMQPNFFSQPAYQDYTYVFARDGVVTNVADGAHTKQKLKPFKHFSYKHYQSKNIDLYFYGILALATFFFVPYVAAMLFIVGLFFAFGHVLSAFASAAVIRLVTKQPFRVMPIFTLGFFIMFPGILYGATLKHFTSFPVWMFYILVTIFLCLVILENKKKNRPTDILPS